MNILTTVASLGAVQGTIICLSIAMKFKHRKNMPLALLLIVFSLRLATIPTWHPDVLLRHSFIYPLTAPLPFLFGPLLWWYIREICSDTLNVPKRLYLHFVPYFLEIAILTITLFSLTSDEYKQFIYKVFSGDPPLWLPVRNTLKVLSNVIYIVLSSRLAFGKRVCKLSQAKRIWIRSLVIIPSSVLVAFSYVAIVPNATKRLMEGTTTPFLILSVTMAILIYSIALLLLITPDMSQLSGKLRGIENIQLCSESECEYLVSLVEKRLAEGAFRNPDISLTDLAAEFNVHPNRLSYAINHYKNMSFRALLNEERLNYFSESIRSGDFQEHSILHIAFEAGFPSKSTFNRVFKEKMGVPPSEYAKSFFINGSH